MESSKKNYRYIKLTSLNPKKYTGIESDDAIKGYTEYLKAYAPSDPKYYNYGKNTLREAKTFSEWLDTEI